jgi:ATP-dependent DNA helicase Rep
VAGVPSRFIAEMKLGEAGGAKEDPRERLRKLRERLASKPQAPAGQDA